MGTFREGFLDWSDDLRFVADVLGVPDRADVALARYADRLAQVRESVGAAFAGRTASIMRTKGDGMSIVVVAGGAFGASIANAAGLPRTMSTTDVPAGSSPDVRRDGEYEIAAEQIGLLDADHLILITRAPGASPEESDQLAALESDPLWQRLRFAQTGSIHRVALGDWLQGSVLAAGRVLDDLDRIAADVAAP